MPQQKSIVGRFENTSVVRFGGPLLFVLLLGSSFSAMFAQQPGQPTFASPQDAGRAFFDAMQKDDDQSLLSILGRSGKEILSSGDPAEDANARIGFVDKYREMHRFMTGPDGTITLIVGAENWPFPIPLVNRNGSWYFDTPAGKDEILFRRIGKNEFAAVDACSDLVQAQKQYFALPLDDLSKQFAQQLLSDQGRHNGLYWQDSYNGLESPISPLIAYADGKSANDQVGDRYPFNGYFFRILISQGPHASGGATNYVINGRMTAGFAFIAYPAEYRSSGVMTFIVNRAGTIYEKDLGPDTTKLAEAMTAYDPDSTWRHVQ